MKDIRIMRLTLENFKCHKYLMLEPAGDNAAIYGDNATGKTSVYDALTWLLFGKDSAGNGEKNMEVKPLNESGEVKDHEAITSVTAVLLVDGVETTLRRDYKEVWSQKRGTGEPTYDGNTSDYFVDGVPMKKNAFQDAVADMVDEETFRMLTSVRQFASDIPWQNRRAVLCKLANIPDDRQLIENLEQFRPLLDGMGRGDLDSYKKKLLAERKKYTGLKSDIPARLSEHQKVVADLSSIDFAVARAQADVLRDKIEQYDKEILAIDHDTRAENLRMEAKQIALDIQALKNENASYVANARAEDPVEQLKRELAAGKRYLSVTQESCRRLGDEKQRIIEHVARLRALLVSTEENVSTAREEWVSENQRVFVDVNCPTCGQRLSAEKLAEARAVFEKEKEAVLNRIQSIAQRNKDESDRIRKDIDQKEAEIKVLSDNITSLEADASSLEASMNAESVKIEHLSSSQAPTPKMPGYDENMEVLVNRMDAVNAELQAVSADSASVRRAMEAQRDTLKQKLRVVMEEIGKEASIAYANGRISELRDEAKLAAETLEKIENQLFLLEEFTRFKTRYVEDGVNSKFRLAKFRLFREQANGGIEDRCDVVVDGVPYSCLNNGMQINVGIDIINTLSAAYGVKVPLFVDNAESVTKIEPCSSQTIRLVVSEHDKEIVMTYED